MRLPTFGFLGRKRVAGVGGDGRSPAECEGATVIQGLAPERSERRVSPGQGERRRSVDGCRVCSTSPPLHFLGDTRHLLFSRGSFGIRETCQTERSDWLAPLFIGSGGFGLWKPTDPSVDFVDFGPNPWIPRCRFHPSIRVGPESWRGSFCRGARLPRNVGWNRNPEAGHGVAARSAERDVPNLGGFRPSSVNAAA